VFKMAITLWRKREPFGFMTDFEREIDRWFGEDWFGLNKYWDDISSDTMESNWTPAVDIEEKDGKIILKAELQGVKKEDIHVELKNGYLTVRGERTIKHEEKKKNYQRIERRHGFFERSFIIPGGVKEKDIHARFKDGVLELTMPVPELKNRKAVEIKVN
jgi:HSP20 family protein